MVTQISAEIIERITKGLWDRNQKGFETYKETLDDVPFDNYDWNVMINEELLDALQYAIKENFRLKQELQERDNIVDTKVFEKDVIRTEGKYREGYGRITNSALGLSGEVGEVVDIIKKFLFQGHALNSEKIIDELGDVMYYLTLMSIAMGSSLDEVMTLNMIKRGKRYPNGFSENDSINRKE